MARKPSGSPDLAEYHRKRDFEKTREPSGADRANGAAGNSFVVQKHAARRLHFDFRLELDGVLKSWAVTKGPSVDPADKRLAVHTEDHPLDYGSFEGVIPQGQYGGGTVMLWDRGTWKALGDARKDYAEGKLKFELDGARMKGAWMLVRMGGKAGKEKRDNWLLIKERDDIARPGAGTSLIDEAMTSVASDRTMEAIAADVDRVWHSDRAADDQPDTVPRTPAAEIEGARPAKLPKAPKPQLATLVDRAPGGAGWIHEIKFDGYRALAIVHGGKARMLTRSGLDWTEKFGPLADALAALPAKDAVLDGEMGVLDDQGVSSFRLLQEALSDGAADRMGFQAFDLLHLDGRDLTPVPLVERKAALRGLLAALPEGSPLAYSDHWDGSGNRFFQQACSMELEGIISKRAAAPYRPGRGRDWVKSKCSSRQEMVIGGFSPSEARPGAVASLLVGYWEGDRLVYAGKVGTGMTDALATDLRNRLETLTRKTMPFADVPKVAAKGVRWAEPELVCEVEFRTWTGSGVMRHASFQGLREDKEAKAVVREQAAPTPPPKPSATPKKAPAKAPAPSKAKAADGPKPADDEPDLDHLGVRLTSPNKVLYKDAGLTKRDLAEYYLAVADYMLPHVARRPLSLVRCPEGSDSECFYQRHPTRGLSEHIHPVEVREKGKTVESLAVEDVKGLVALVQMGALEIHPWGSRIDDPEKPDRLILDLDPDTEIPFSRVVEAAHAIRGFLKDLGLESFVKTTGGKGLHLYVPIQRRHDWAEAKAFTKAIASAVSRAAPDEYTDNMAKTRRTGRIYVDYLRNDRGATAVGAWSTRARPGATVSMPLDWSELTTDLDPKRFSVEKIGERLKMLKSDPWAEMGDLRQSISAKARKSIGMK